MATKKQIRDFALVKNGYKKIDSREKKPTHGSLSIDGIIKEWNLPFPLLQYKRKKLIESGIAPRRIKISYI